MYDNYCQLNVFKKGEIYTYPLHRVLQNMFKLQLIAGQ